MSEQSFSANAIDHREKSVWRRRCSIRVAEILNSLCNEFLPMNVSAILYLMNYEKYGRSTASAQYFLQLAGYLGIPVIAWNADNSGLERVSWNVPFLSSQHSFTDSRFERIVPQFILTKQIEIKVKALRFCVFFDRGTIIFKMIIVSR